MFELTNIKELLALTRQPPQVDGLLPLLKIRGKCLSEYSMDALNAFCSAYFGAQEYPDCLPDSPERKVLECVLLEIKRRTAKVPDPDAACKAVILAELYRHVEQAVSTPGTIPLFYETATLAAFNKLVKQSFYSWSAASAGDILTLQQPVSNLDRRRAWITLDYTNGTDPVITVSSIADIETRPEVVVLPLIEFLIDYSKGYRNYLRLP